MSAALASLQTQTVARCRRRERTHTALLFTSCLLPNYNWRGARVQRSRAGVSLRCHAARRYLDPVLNF